MTDCHRIQTGDCIGKMQAMDGNSVHAVVTDPPYGLAFMPGVNDWDEFDSPSDYQEWCEEWASEALRVLKPGGHLVAFSGNRTYGRLMCGVQDAGFEIRDTLTWLNGQGFPKGQDVGKHIDRYYDAEDEREVVGKYHNPDGTTRDYASCDASGRNALNAAVDGSLPEKTRDITAPATPEAEQWDGWKTALKPSTEFAVLARAPMSEDAIYKNVLEHDTGALNIDRTRSSDGRYPTNCLLDPGAARMLDGQSGGAYRFFYCVKASPNERTVNGEVENDHSTVKPLDLMEWLVALVTAPGQRVLDPFAGSGTTIMACRRLGREGIGIEKDNEYAEVARKRVELAHELETSSGEFDADDDGEADQPGLDTFADGGDAHDTS